MTSNKLLFSDACDLTLDLNTANNHLILSEGNKKATCGELQSYPKHSERFDLVPQVLCREGLTGRHYLEVQLSNDSTTQVGIAVSYQSIRRKGGDETEFGANSKSWYVGTYFGTGFSVWHNGKLSSGSLPSAGCSRVGVFLDYPAGTVSFYAVSSSTLTHLHTFRTRFKEPVYPGFWIKNTSNYVKLSPV